MPRPALGPALGGTPGLYPHPLLQQNPCGCKRGPVPGHRGFGGKASAGWWLQTRPGPAAASAPWSRELLPREMCCTPQTPRGTGRPAVLEAAQRLAPQTPGAEAWCVPAERQRALLLRYLLDREVVDQVVVVFVQVTVQRDTVALVEQVLERVDSLHSQGPLYAILQVRVIKYHVEAKRLGSDCNRLGSATCVRGKERFN